MKRFVSLLSNQRGDTIVEVLFALGILGAVLGSSYVVVSRNVITNRASQERLQAVKIAESQFEKLKIKVASDDTMYDRSGFCLTNTNNVVLSSALDCKMDAAGDATTAPLQYRVTISRDNYLPYGGNPRAGTRFKINVTWANVRGGGDDKLDYFYEAYR